jgi:acetyltransferase-like isoleucine patch superfamily enzyme
MRTGNRLVVEDDVFIKIEDTEARFVLGDRVFIGKGCEFDVVSQVSIGSNCLIAPGVFITDHNHGVEVGQLMNDQPCTAAPVTIGSDVWIGTKATILPGVTIGDGAVIGAHAVVTKDIRVGAVAVGVPARQIGERG